MDFISNSQEQNKEMLQTIGVSSLEELFRDIPLSLKRKKPQNDDGLSESEVLRLMEKLGQKNSFSQFTSYLGAGAYEHYVPALVGAVTSKSEFLTSYTPYQAEASQGLLQMIFEFQSAVCALTGMAVSNASVYDGASACAEALLMALRHSKGRNKVVIAENVNPFYRKVVEQYLSSHRTDIVTIPYAHDGTIDQNELNKEIDDQTAAVLIQSPNFFGVMEESKAVSRLAHTKNALLVLCSNPLAYGLYASAQECGADIAVGDCQPFGLALNFGGPYAGYMATTPELIRQLPGRIVGETVDTEGKRGFVLTLQAREQHIRREKATSNICTNQALASVAALTAILWYGKEGIPKLALSNYQRTMYLKTELEKAGLTTLGGNSIFNEFAVAFNRPIAEVMARFEKNNVIPGLDLGRFYPALKNHLLVSVTETKNKEQLDAFVASAKEVL